MGKGSFRALVAVGVLVPVAIVLAILIHPRGRALVSSFFAPLPEPSRDAGTVSLPPLAIARGAESAELRTLREDASAQTNATPAAVRARTALFGLGADGEIPAGAERFARPSGLRRPEIMIRDDASIDRAVQHLTADAGARERFVDALRRSGRFAPEITRILRAWKLSEILLAVSFVESAFQPTAASTADNAMGLWQLTPDVAHVYGLSMLLSYDERRGVSTGTEAAARYLADLRERFGSWELALVGYAIGYKRTGDAVTKFASTDFWELAPALPRAATVYVAEVMGTAVLLANLDRFGLDTVKRAEPTSVSELDVPAGTSLPLVARAAAVAPVTLRELNPEYGSDIVPTTSFPMVVHVPSDTLARARELLPLLQDGKDTGALGDAGAAEAGAPNVPPVISRGTDKRMFYRVKEGDTLASLARENGTSVDIIASDNALDSTSSLRPGMILAIRLPEPASPDPSHKNLPPPKNRRKPAH
jgi:membrane-bound lytic murein transglycosylase D